MTDPDVQALATRVDSDFPDGVATVAGYGYPDSLALCAIDSVYSLRAHYSGVGKAISTYKASRSADGADPSRDSLADLIGAIDRAAGPASAARSLFANEQLAPGTKRRKAEALYSVANRLVEAGIVTSDDLRLAAEDPTMLKGVEKLWRGEPGLGYASWRYVGMLAGVPGVKVDRMIIRYVQSVIGTDATVGRIERAVEGVAALRGVPVHELDNAIWRRQSGRSSA